MKFYLASRTKNRELIKNIRKKLTGLGHEVTSTWVDEKNIIPHEKHLEATRKRARQCIKDCSNSDVFILISDETGSGMYTELGAALLSNSDRKTPEIYIIGKYLDRSVFFFYPGVKRFETFEEVLQDINNHE